MDIDKMNDCILAGMLNKKAQAVVDQCFHQMAEFTNNHMTDEAGMLIEKHNLNAPGKPFNRGEILDMFMEDMHVTIFNLRK